MESIFSRSKNHRGRLGELLAIAPETFWTRGAAVLQPGYPAGGGSGGPFSAERGHGEYAALGSHLPESLAIRRPTLSGAPRLAAGGPAARQGPARPLLGSKRPSRSQGRPASEEANGGAGSVPHSVCSRPGIRAGPARLRSGGNPGKGLACLSRPSVTAALRGSCRLVDPRST